MLFYNGFSNQFWIFSLAFCAAITLDILLMDVIYGIV